jgi:hypothetical protein
VTREHPKIDRIACPWLIRRFIDPNAEFIYVPKDRVLAVAKQTGGIPYDIDGVEFTHEGERCSFDTILRIYEIMDPALDHLATIVRGADTSRHDLSPQCGGLFAISLGVKAIVRAHRWRNMLESGDYATVRELAKAEAINESYLGRVLRLTLLAPKIIEAILPASLELDDLLKQFPIEWDKQLATLTEN